MARFRTFLLLSILIVIDLLYKLPADCTDRLSDMRRRLDSKQATSTEWVDDRFVPDGEMLSDEVSGLLKVVKPRSPFLKLWNPELIAGRLKCKARKQNNM